MLLFLCLYLFNQTPTDPPVIKPAPSPGETATLNPAVKSALMIQRKELELKMERADFEISKDVVKWNLFVGSFFGLLGLNLLAVFLAYRKSQKHFFAYMDKKLQEQADSLFAVLDNYDQDLKLKADTRIHLLTADGNNQIRGLLMRWGFKKVTPALADTFLAKADRNAFDLLLFDRLDADQINQILAEMPDQISVVYAPDGTLKGVNRERVNFANSQITLFTRILETARFNRDNQS